MPVRAEKHLAVEERILALSFCRFGVHTRAGNGDIADAPAGSRNLQE
jgi:hypothetical protein